MDDFAHTTKVQLRRDLLEKVVKLQWLFVYVELQGSIVKVAVVDLHKIEDEKVMVETQGGMFHHYFNCVVIFLVI